MPNNAVSQTTDELTDDLEEFDDFSPEDYCFVLGPDGSLKTIFVPENLMEDPPEEVKIILNLFGIDDIHKVDYQVLH